MIMIFTAKDCPYCEKTKKFFSDRKVNFIEKEVTENPEAMKQLIDLGRFGTPLIIVDGKEVVGFDEERLEELLND